MPRPVHIIGVSLDLGGNRRGVDMGPSAFRIAGLAEHLAALGIAVVDEGDLVAPIPEVKTFGDPNKKYIREIARVCERLYKTSLAVLEKGGIPLVLGGDHSLGAGSVAATAEFLRRENKPLGLIWVDAHGDMNTPGTSSSGNVHGMPLAALLGPEPAELSRIGGFSPKVSPERTVLIGIRNLDDREKERIRESGVRVFPQLPRSAHVHGDGCRLRPAPGTGPRGGESDPRRSEHDGHPRRRTGVLSARSTDLLNGPSSPIARTMEWRLDRSDFKSVGFAGWM